MGGVRWVRLWAVLLSVFASLAPALRPAGAITTGLVAAYSFDEGAGSLAADVTGGGHTGTLSNASWSPAGHSGAALSLNGTNGWVTLTDAADLQLTTALTIEAWIRPASLSSWRTVIMREQPGGLVYALYASGDTNRPSAYGNAGGVDVAAIGTGALPLNAWTHLAATYDGSTLRLFVNGAATASTPLPGPLTTSASPLRVGGNSVWGEYFSGLVDDVRIYGRALTAAEISADMGTPVAPDTTPPVVAMTAPMGGATISGTFTLAATATDNVSVAGVQFLLDGAPLGAEVSAAPYYLAWDTNTASVGPHTVAARARDASGNVATSAPRNLTVERSADTNPPVVSITSPAEGATVTGTFPVTANAADNVGVAGVQFFVDGSPLGPEVTNAPYTVPWDTTTVTSGTQHGLSARARDGAGNTTTSAVVGVTVSNTDPRAATGEWSSPVGVPVIMMHATLLPGSSRVLFFEDGVGARVVDGNTGVVTAVPVNSNLFCAGHAFLANGRPIVIGGDAIVASADGIVDTNVFDPATNSWARVADMNYKRWYPTATALPDGRVLALSGSSNGCLSCFVQTPEVYDPVANRWTTMPSANLNLPYYPFVHVLPDGRVLQVGTSESATSTRVLDLQAQAWSTVDPRVIDGGSSVMYRPGKVLMAGTASDGNRPEVPSSSAANVLDMSAPAPAWRQVAPMANGRAFLNLTSLPDGNVLATGGTSTAGGTIVANAVKAAELWSPVTEQWTTLASEQRPRSYHSVAMLLPDGRVLVGGGGNDGAVPNEYNYEIFSPPYLFRGPRPTITSTPSLLTYGQSFTVGTPQAPRIASVSLIAPASVTHAFDMNARFVPLTFSESGESGGLLSVQAPANPNLAPPGNYMLFVVDTNGVPSVASWVRLPTLAEDTVPPSAPGPLSAFGDVGRVSLYWQLASDNYAVTGYNVYRSTVGGFTPGPANLVAQVGGNSYLDSGLAAGTYYYRVAARDAAGNFGPPSNEASGTATGGADTSAPSVAVTAPANGASVSGTITVSANASDNVGVTGVQLLLDGAPLGARVTSPPHQVAWDSRGVPNGSHSIGAQAFDAAGNVGTAAPVTVTVTNTAPPSAISVDTVTFRDFRGTATTASFSTAEAGEVLLAFVSADGPSGQAQTATVTGAGLTWTLVRRVNTRAGTSEVWQATAAAKLTNVTVRSALSRTGFDQSLTVVALKGVSGVGASAGASALNGAPTVQLTTSAPGAWVFAVGNDWDSAVARTLGPGQTMVHEWVDTGVGDTFWVQRLTNAVPSAGTVVTLNDTAPTTNRWNLVAVEVVPR